MDEVGVSRQARHDPMAKVLELGSVLWWAERSQMIRMRLTRRWRQQASKLCILLVASLVWVGLAKGYRLEVRRRIGEMTRGGGVELVVRKRRDEAWMESSSLSVKFFRDGCAAATIVCIGKK